MFGWIDLYYHNYKMIPGRLGNLSFGYVLNERFPDFGLQDEIIFRPKMLSYCLGYPKIIKKILLWYTLSESPGVWNN